MARPFRLSIGPFAAATLNNRTNPNQLQPHEFQTLNGVDLDAGTLRGLPDAGTALAGTNLPGGASDRWIHYAGGATWLTSPEQRWSLNDADTTIFTRSGQPPQVRTTTATRDLGIVPLAAMGTDLLTGQAPGLAAGVYQYAIIFETADGLTSNKQTFDITFTADATWNGLQLGSAGGPITSADPRVTIRRIYRTQAAGSVFYRLATINDNVTVSYTDDGGDSLNLTQSLTWDIEGFPQQDGEAAGARQYMGDALGYADHSPPPNLTVLANTLHGTGGEVGLKANGILFGAIGNQVRWSALGLWDYWPAVNEHATADDVEAIISQPAGTAVATSSVWELAQGSRDDAIDWQQLPAKHYVKAGAGKSVVLTSHGVIFWSREGPAVFDGTSSRLLLPGQLSQTWIDAITVYGAAYWQGRYYLFHSTGTLVLDFRNGPENVRARTTSQVIRAAHVADFHEPISATVRRPHPSTLDGFRSCAVMADTGQNRIYVAGGSYLTPFSAAGQLTYDGASAIEGEVATDIAYYWDRDGAISANEWTARTSFATVGGNTRRTDAQGSFGTSGGTNFFYVYGGRTRITTIYSDLQVHRLDTNAWTSVAAAGGPGARYQAMQATDGTNLWVIGGLAAVGGDPQNDIRKYTGGLAGSWSTLTAPGAANARYAAAACWVPGAVAGNTNGVILVFGGLNASDVATATLSIYNVDTGAWTIVADAVTLAAGVAARGYHVLAYDSVTQKVFLHGGWGGTGILMSDLWEFDPANCTVTTPTAASWVAHASYVQNYGPRYGHGGAFLGGSLYLFGGASNQLLWNNDLVRVDVLSLDDYDQTPNLFVLKDSDSGNVRPWGTGARLATTILTGDFAGEDPGAYKVYEYVFIDYEGDVNLAASLDGGAVTEFLALSSATRISERIPLPFGAAQVEGRRIALQAATETAAGAASGVAGQVFALSFEGAEDGRGAN